MTSVRLDYGYRVSFVPPRSRASRVVELPDTTTLDIPDLAASDAPEVVRARVGNDLYRRILVDGMLYGPTDLPAVPADGPLRIGPNWIGHNLFLVGGAPWNRWNHRIEDPEPPAGSRIARDERDATRVAVRAEAANLVAVEGRIWRRMREPMLALGFTLASTGNRFVSAQARYDDDPGFLFGLDRRGAFDTFCAAARRAGLKGDDNVRDYEILSGHEGPGRFAEDVANAATALRYAVRCGGVEIDGVEAAALRMLADAKLLATAIEEGMAAPGEALALLSAMPNVRADRTPKFACAIAVGTAAVAASRPGLSPVHSQDMDSLGALAR